MVPLALQRDERFTYGDYLTWDDGERWELIDGVPYSMSPAPGVAHQRILGRVHFQLFSFLRDKPCQVFLAPFDVRLPEADESDELVETVVQPDLVIICDQSKLDQRGCRGAPDLVVEILSSSTAHHDLKVKFARYERAGVREYWIIDPLGKTTQVFSIASGGGYGRPQVYGCGDMAPVGVIPGLMIDLAEIFAE